jgi:hypothetical protein
MCRGVDLDQDRLVVVLYTSSLAAEYTGPSHRAGMLRLPPWRYTQAAGSMTWTHEERQVLPSGLAEEALHMSCPRLTTLTATMPWLKDMRVLVEAA